MDGFFLFGIKVVVYALNDPILARSGSGRLLYHLNCILLCEFTVYHIFTSLECGGITRAFQSLIDFELSPGA